MAAVSLTPAVAYLFEAARFETWLAQVTPGYQVGDPLDSREHPLVVYLTMLSPLASQWCLVPQGLEEWYQGQFLAVYPAASLPLWVQRFVQRVAKAPGRTITAGQCLAMLREVTA
jgi:hypothetical protein